MQVNPRETPSSGLPAGGVSASLNLDHGHSAYSLPVEGAGVRPFLRVRHVRHAATVQVRAGDPVADRFGVADRCRHAPQVKAGGTGLRPGDPRTPQHPGAPAGRASAGPPSPGAATSATAATSQVRAMISVAGRGGCSGYARETRRRAERVRPTMLKTATHRDSSVSPQVRGGAVEHTRARIATQGVLKPCAMLVTTALQRGRRPDRPL